MTAYQVDPLPTAPSRKNPSTFSSDMDLFLSAMDAFRSQLNSLGTDASANATLAQQYAAQAAATVMSTGATKWISGTSYAQGDNVWSPINFQTYKRKTAGAGTTDPANDYEVNWALVGINGNMMPVNSNTNFIRRRYRINDNNTSWYRAAVVTLAPGTYQGVCFMVTVTQGFYNGNGTDTSQRHQFSVWCQRSGAVDLDNEVATLFGTSTDYVRVIKTQAGGVGVSTVYELQMRQPAASKDCMFEVSVNSMSVTSPGSILWDSILIAGTTSGTVSSPTLATTPIAGGLTVAGSTLLSLGAQFGNTAVGDATTLDWYEEGSFTGTATGVSGSVTGTITFTRVGRSVVLEIPTFAGTSNSANFTITGMPTNIRPAATKQVFVRITDNGAATPVMGLAWIASSGVITVYATLAGSTGAVWTSSGTKTVYQQNDVSYNI